MDLLILDIESEWGLGPGGLADLDTETQARLIARARVRKAPGA